VPRMTARLFNALAVVALASLVLSPLTGAWAAPASMRQMAQVMVAAGAPLASAPVELTFEVTYKGFNGQKGTVIPVSVGQDVKLTFVWADKAVPDNSHRILIKGYNVRTPLLTPENPQATITFVADKAGTFEVACDWRCEGHENIQAVLRVTGEGAAAGATTATAITLKTATNDEARSMTFTATLRDTDGSPLANAVLLFYLEKELAGYKGQAEIGSASTDKDGVAVIEFAPSVHGLQKGGVRFEGLGRYASAETKFEVNTEHLRNFTVAPKGLEPVRQWAPVVLFMVVVGVWLTIGYVVFNILAIPRGRRSSRNPGGLAG